jgi:3-hydroxyacyl-CoA dehydrogenase
VTQEAEQYLAEDGIFASNTSTLPITGLATASKDAKNFIGLHFFSLQSTKCNWSKSSKAKKLQLKH